MPEAAEGGGGMSTATSHAIYTEADYKAWRFKKDAVHLNGGNVFFGYGHRCIDQPRLLVIDKYFKRNRSTVRSYVVDGKTPCASLEQALAALSTPPALTTEELSLLGTMSPEWYRPETRGELLPLAEMGMIEWGRDADDKVTCRLTAVGIEQLTRFHRPIDTSSWSAS